MTRMAWSAALISLAAGSTEAQAFQLAPAAQRLTLAKVVADAAPPVQLLMAALVLAAAACLALRLAGLANRPRPASLFRMVATAAPLLSLATAAYEALHASLGIVNLRPTPNLVALAPAAAEAMLVLTLGLLAGAVAAILRGGPPATP